MNWIEENNTWTLPSPVGTYKIEIDGSTSNKSYHIILDNTYIECSNNLLEAKAEVYHNLKWRRNKINSLLEKHKIK